MKIFSKNKIIKGLEILVVFIFILVFLLTSSAIQTRIALFYTKKFNLSYTANLSLDNVKIDLDGHIVFSNLLVNDHKKDTLLFIPILKSNWLDGLNFSLLKIEKPSIYIRKYPGDSLDNLSQYIQDFKAKVPKKETENSTLLEFDKFVLDSLNVYLSNLNNDNQKDTLSNLYLEIEHLKILKDTLTLKVDSFKYTSKNYGTIEDFTGSISLLDKELSISDFSLNALGQEIEGQLKLKNLEVSKAFEEKTEVELKVEKLKIDLNQISSLKNKYLKPNVFVHGNLDFKGKLNNFILKLNTKIDEESFLVGVIEGKNVLSKNNYRLISNDLNANLEVVELSNKLETEFISKAQKYIHSLSYIQSDLSFDLSPDSLFVNSGFKTNLGDFDWKLKSKKNVDIKVMWETKTTLKISEIEVKKIIESVPLDFYSGTLNIDLNSISFQPQSLHFSGVVDSLKWNSKTFNALYFSGLKNEKIFDFNLDSKDEKIQFNSENTFYLAEQDSLISKTNLTKVNLTTLEIASLESESEVSVRLDLSRTKKGNFSLNISDLNFKNSLDSLSFATGSANWEKSETQQKINLFIPKLIDFNVEGDFEFKNIGKLIDNNLRDIFFQTNLYSFEREEHLSFDILLNGKFISTYIKNLSSLDDVKMKGVLSATPYHSFFDVYFPNVKYNKMNMQDLKIIKPKQGLVFNTYLSVESIQYLSYKLKDLNLLFTTNNNNYFSRIEASFGDTERLEMNMKFLNENNSYSVSFLEGNIFLNERKWHLGSTKNIDFEYNYITKDFTINPIIISHEKERIDLTGQFNAVHKFLDVGINDLQIEDFVTFNKFNKPKGVLNAKFHYTNKITEKPSFLDLKISEFHYNKTYLGDLNISAQGNALLKNYTFEANIQNEATQIISFKGNYLRSDNADKFNIDLSFDEFSLGIVPKLNNAGITNIEGLVSGKLNIWGTKKQFFTNGFLRLIDSSFLIPFTNVEYKLEPGTEVVFNDQNIKVEKSKLYDLYENREGIVNASFSHDNFSNWGMDIQIDSDNMLVMKRERTKEGLFYGSANLDGSINLYGPVSDLKLTITGNTAPNTTIIFPFSDKENLNNSEFIEFIDLNSINKKNEQNEREKEKKLSSIFNLEANLEINENAEFIILYESNNESTVKGKGNGDLQLKFDTEGEFTIYGDYTIMEGTYDYSGFGLINKAFDLKYGSSVNWEGSPLDAQINLEALYKVPGGVSPGGLINDPSFNTKIPTFVTIALRGSLLRPDTPVFGIEFSNISGILQSDIESTLNTTENIERQAISLLTQGDFNTNNALSFQNLTDNLYEKTFSALSDLIFDKNNKLNLGLDYTRRNSQQLNNTGNNDSFGVTLSTNISDKVFINGKIGVPISGVEESLIVGDIQIDFILNDKGNLRASVFNTQNEFRYIGENFGYTQGVGLKYDVDFNTFKEFLNQVVKKELQKR